MACSCTECMGRGTFKCDWPDDPEKCARCNYPRDTLECEEGVMLCKVCDGMGFIYRDKNGNRIDYEEYVRIKQEKI
jgi:hypothetical protein